MGYVLAILAIIAAATSAVGAYSQAQSAKNEADYNADVNRKNAQTAQQQAEFDAEQIRNRNKRILGAQRAAQSASGIDPNTGTATDIRADSAAQGEMDALVAIYTGRTSANASIAQARLSSIQGQNASRAGNWGVATSLLGGATSATYYASNPKFKSK